MTTLALIISVHLPSNNTQTLSLYGPILLPVSVAATLMLYVVLYDMVKLYCDCDVATVLDVLSLI